MPGGIMHVAVCGVDDMYLTGHPQVTFFKVMYRRHTHFALEPIEYTIGAIDLGDTINFKMPRVGDAIYDVYLKLRLPVVSLKRIDLATDLSFSQQTYLSTAYTYPNNHSALQVIASQIAEHYQTIVSFQRENMRGFRVADSLRRVTNQTAESYTNAIIAAIDVSAELRAQYVYALTSAALLVRDNDIRLDPDASAIIQILQRLVLDPINAGKYTWNDFDVDDIYDIVVKSVDISKLTKQFFFEHVKQSYVQRIDEISLDVRFAWVKNIGTAIIDWIEMRVGPEKFDKHSGDYLNIRRQLTRYENDATYDRMMGNVLELITYDKNPKPEYTLIVPLAFWYCVNPGLVFPHISLQYEPISIAFKTKTFEECAYVEKLRTQDGTPLQNAIELNELTLNDIWDNKGYTINASIVITYVYFSTIERRRFARTGIEYLIDVVDEMEISSADNAAQIIDLAFSGTSKELLWRVQKNAYIQGDSNNVKHWFEYSTGVDANVNPIVSPVITLNGVDRYDKLHELRYFDIVQPWQHHTHTPSSGINVYSFCLKPEEYQPTGTLCFSRFAHPVLRFNIDDGMFTYNTAETDPYLFEAGVDLPTTVNIRIYSKRTTVIRFYGGMCGFAFV